MAEKIWFVDTGLATGSNDGTSMDDAWQNIETAMEYASMDATRSNWIFIRRGSSYVCVADSADISMGDSGSMELPINWCGWPRNSHAVSSSDWTQGLTTVTIDDADMDREKHCGRWITAPDGNNYLITRVVSSTSILIDRDYPGTTQSDQAATILADPEYFWANYLDTVTANAGTDIITTSGDHPYHTGSSVYLTTTDTLPDPLSPSTEYFAIFVSYTQLRLATTYNNAKAGTYINLNDAGTGTHLIRTIDDTSWTITKITWNTDAHTLPLLDFDDYNSQLALGSDYNNYLRNLSLKDSSDTNGILYVSGSNLCVVSGCLFKQTTANSALISGIYPMNFYGDRIIGEGIGSSSSNQDGFKWYYCGSNIVIKNSAFYGCGNSGITLFSGNMELENVNLGVEIANYDTDIGFAGYAAGALIGRDVKFGASVGYVSLGSGESMAKDIRIENFQKQLGVHRGFFGSMDLEMATLTGATTPNKKLSDVVIKLSWNSSLIGHPLPEEGRMDFFKILEDEFEASTTSRSYKYWVFNNAAGVLNGGPYPTNLYAKLEYIADHTDNDERYVVGEEISTELKIGEAADATDWDYISVESIAPAVASKVRIRIYVNHYHSTGSVFVDPVPLIS